ncbi:MAG: NADH:flavin oxidoreductase [Rhodospirillales bacterium]|nr:NADH:flavin oxidoreductase [Rhodospirillales bacterium]
MPGGKYPKLFAPGRLGGLALANRYVVAPMERISATPGGVATDEMRDYYAAFAAGGFGLIVAEGTFTDLKSSQAYPTQPGLASGAQIAGWRRVTNAVHQAGGKIIVQLMHAGALILGNTYGGRPIAPSKVLPKGEKSPRFGGAGPYEMPEEITLKGIDDVIRGHAEAAENAIAAGFDGVEIHGATGYLLDEFLTDYTNQRQDEYSGALENRLRLHCRTVTAVRGAIAGRGITGIRISEGKVNDFDHRWPGGADDAKIIFSSLKEAGADFIHIAARDGAAEVFNSGHSLAGLARDYAGLPIIAAGNLHDPKAATELLERGEADFIGIGKGAIADPSLPIKISRGEAPVPFHPEMLVPLATIENTLRWLQDNKAG